ncbi:MAG TPA: DNA repair exonuclease [Oligoflexia bacterium]|nr:DNA repair exonuclease [Oligoflexia bacterium]HMP47980.1 DNA repair exonuclease [Oligoflexia bacterium]
MFSFLHAADIHLDTPFQNISRYPAALAEILLEASFIAFANLVDLAIRENVDFIILAGDIYDGRDVGIRAEWKFLSFLRVLGQNGISVFILSGNHEGGRDFSLIKDWPDNVHFFSDNEAIEFPVYRRDELIAHVIGRNYIEGESGSSSLAEYRKTLIKNNSDSDTVSAVRVPRIGVFHGTVGAGVTRDGDYAAIHTDELIRLNCDYWALGHLHEFNLIRSGNPFIVYSGTIQGRSFKSSERGEKGAVLVKGAGEKVISVEFKSLSKIIFIEERFTASDIVSPAELASKISLYLKENLHKNVSSESIKNQTVICLRLIIHVESELASILSDYFLRREFEDALIEVLFKEKNVFLPDIRYKVINTRPSALVNEILNLAENVLDELMIKPEELQRIFKDESRIQSRFDAVPLEDIRELALSELSFILSGKRNTDMESS